MGDTCSGVLRPVSLERGRKASSRLGLLGRTAPVCRMFMRHDWQIAFCHHCGQSLLVHSDDGRWVTFSKCLCFSHLRIACKLAFLTTTNRQGYENETKQPVAHEKNSALQLAAARHGGWRGGAGVRVHPQTPPRPRVPVAI